MENLCSLAKWLGGFKDRWAHGRYVSLKHVFIACPGTSPVPLLPDYYLIYRLLQHALCKKCFFLVNFKMSS